jgi:hypothetical protein
MPALSTDRKKPSPRQFNFPETAISGSPISCKIRAPLRQNSSPASVEFKTLSLEKRAPFLGLHAKALSRSQVKKERR